MGMNEYQLWFVGSELVLAVTALWIALKFVIRGSAAHGAFAGALVLLAMAALAGAVRIGFDLLTWVGIHQALVDISGTVGFILLGAGALEAAHQGMISKSPIRMMLVLAAIVAAVLLVIFDAATSVRPAFFAASLIAGILAGAVLSGRGQAPAALMMWAMFAVQLAILIAMMAGWLNAVAPGYAEVLFHFLMAVWCVMVLRAVTFAIPKARAAEDGPWQVLE